MWYAITLAVGLALLAGSLFLLKKTMSFLRNSERATATVIGLDLVRGNDGDTYKAIFKFKTHLNKEIIYKQNSSSNPPSWSVDEQTTIAYDRNNPNEARLLTYFGSFGWTVVLMAIAMPMIVIGGGYFLSQSYLK